MPFTPGLLAAREKSLTVRQMVTLTPRTVRLDMIRESFKGLEDRFPPMLSLEQAADLLGSKEQSIRRPM